ncbi:MAG TPA: heme-copper oxidase subunit III [Candidatus Dormibacteraeota bacterium]
MAVAAQPQPRPVAHPTYPGISVGMMGMYIFLTSEVMFFGSLFAMYFYIVGSHEASGTFQWPPPGTDAVKWWPLPMINTFVLFCSGVTCHFALESLRHAGRRHLYGSILLVFFVIAMLVSGIVALAGTQLGTPLGLGSAESLFDPILAFAGFVVALLCIPAMFGVAGFVRGRMQFFTLWIGTILLGAGFEAGQAYEFINQWPKLHWSGLNQFGNAFYTMTGFHGGHVAGGLILLLLILYRAGRGQFSPQHHVGPAAVTLYWHFVDVVWIFLFGILYLAVTAGQPVG